MKKIICILPLILAAHLGMAQETANSNSPTSTFLSSGTILYTGETNSTLIVIAPNNIYLDSISKYQDLQSYYNKFGTPTQQVQNGVMVNHWIEKAKMLEREQAKQQAKKELEIKYKIKL